VANAEKKMDILPYHSTLDGVVVGPDIAASESENVELIPRQRLDTPSPWRIEQYIHFSEE
jgi:hypothetical protein